MKTRSHYMHKKTYKKYVRLYGKYAYEAECKSATPLNRYFIKNTCRAVKYRVKYI